MYLYLSGQETTEHTNNILSRVNFAHTMVYYHCDINETVGTVRIETDTSGYNHL